MLRKLLLGLLVLLLVLGIGLWMAPARLASNLLTRVEGSPVDIRLLGPRGTLWSGSGQLLVNATPIGSLAWQVRPGRLLGAEAAVDFQLAGTDFTATGTAAARRTSLDIRDINARFSERFLQSVLARYDIAPTGTLRIDDLDVTDLRFNEAGTWPSQISAAGAAYWTGGAVNYRLAGQAFDIELPAMQGDITTSEQGVNPGWPELLVKRADDAAPLITGRLTPSGSAAIGITRGFTRLAGQPWPGSEPDHAVVLEVEEQLN